MIELYYARPSLFARPVWLALLEKRLPFELIPVDLSGEQFKTEFLSLNPFSHVPILVDDAFRVIESSAILDYLEAKYPYPSLLPTDAEALARVRMVQMVALNELLPAIVRLLITKENSSKKSTGFEYAQLQTTNALSFLEELLGNSCYFAGKQLTLAEIVAGTLIYRVSDLGITLTDYPSLNSWSNRLLIRTTWKQIELSTEEWLNFKRHMQILPKIWQRCRYQRINALS